MMKCVSASGVCIVPRVERADTMAKRLRGLLGRDGLEPGHGLLISECGSVHTVGMQFAIDVIFMRRDGTVTRVCRNLEPVRIALGGFGANQALEVQSGWLPAGVVDPGDILRFEPDSAGGGAT